MSERPDLTRLLAESRWLVALARRLVADGEEAEDLAQETLAAVLAHPPQDDRPLRGWLATVLRGRFVDRQREQGARRTRERQSSRREALPPTDDVVAKAEQQRLLVAAVLALTEPERTTVLLRFFECLPPRAIARRMQVSVPTVNSRLQRALAKLRESLDRTQGRTNWLSALTPLTVGVSIVNGALKIGLSTAALALVCYWLWPRAEPLQPEQAQASSVATPLSEPATAKELQLQPTLEPGLSSSRSASTPAVPPASVAAPAQHAALRGRVLDLAGHGVAHVRLGWEASESAHEFGQSSVDGRFELEQPQGATAIVSVDPRWSTVLSGSARIAPTNEACLLVAPRLDLGGRVVDEVGAPLAGVEIGLHLAQHLGAELGILLDYSLPRAWRTRSDADGQWSLADVPQVEHAALHLSLSGYVTRIEPLPAAPDGSLLFVLERPHAAEELVRGVVLDPSGASVEGARVSAGAEVALTDAHGEFALEIAGKELLPRLVALAEGYQAALFEPELEAGKPRWPARVVLHLGPAPLELSGRVLGADRAPRAGVRVWIVDPLYVGQADGGAVLAESLGAGGKAPFWNYQTSAADGTFTIRGLRERAYALAAIDPRTLARADAVHVAAGAGDVELLLPGDLREHVRGRIVARDGTGIAGVSVKFQRPVLEVKIPGGTEDQWASSEPVTSGKDGYYELRDVPREGVEIFAYGDAILFASRDLHADCDAEHFDVLADRRVHLQVELEPPLARADTLQVLDAAGKPMILRVMRGESSYTGRKSTISEGRSQILSLGEGAREVVFLLAGVEVGRVPVTLAPGELHTLRW
jgi:RNA polymerase sigma-70 factor, ECF subfamily